MNRAICLCDADGMIEKVYSEGVLKRLGVANDIYTKKDVLKLKTMA